MLHMMLPGLVDFVVSCRPSYATYNTLLMLSKVGIEELHYKVPQKQGGNIWQKCCQTIAS